MAKFASKLSTYEHSHARVFEKYGICTFSQAVKAYTREDTAQLKEWDEQLNAKVTAERTTEDFEKIKATYQGRYGAMTVAEYAYADATFAANKLVPESKDAEETTWTDYCLSMHTQDFPFTAENQAEYQRLFKEEYARRYLAYFQDGD